MATLDQSDLRFFSEALPEDAVLLREMVGREALSRLYEYELELRTVGQENVITPNLPALFAEPACVVFSPGKDSDPVVVWGVLREIEAHPHNVDHALHRVVLVPRLWYATQVRRSRIFQELSYPEIVAQVLTEMHFKAGEDFELRLRSSYPKREYTVQYEETDYAFICRLLEEEGVFFFFEHTSGCDKIVLCDNTAGLRELPEHNPIRYATWGMDAGEATVSRLSFTTRVVPENVLLVDYNWRTPAVGLGSISKREGPGMVMTAMDHYRTSENGERVAQIRAEEIQIGKAPFRGRSTARTLRPGDVLTVETHPEDVYNRRYLITEIVHRVSQWFDGGGGEGKNGAYANDFTAIQAEVPFRPARTTPKPRIDGVTYATIDGPCAGTPAPIDEQGRYKVLMAFDQTSAPGGTATRTGP